MTALPAHEQEFVALTAAFVDRRVRPRVAEFEVQDRYPDTNEIQRTVIAAQWIARHPL